MGWALAALAPRLDGPTANRASAALVQVAGRTDNANVMLAAAEGLATLAPRLDPTAAAQACGRLVAALDKATDPRVFEPTSNSLAALAPWLDGPAALRSWQWLAGMIRKYSAGQSAVRALVPLALRLDASAVDQASTTLIDELERTQSWSTAAMLAALAPRLDPSVADRASSAVLSAVDKAADARACMALAILTPRLKGQAAARAWDALASCLIKSSDVNEFSIMPADGLAALAPRLDPPAVPRAFATAVQLIERANSTYVADRACIAAFALSEKVDPQERQAHRMQVANAVIAGLRRMRDADKWSENYLYDLWFVIDQFEPVIRRSVAAGKLTPIDIGTIRSLGNWLSLGQGGSSLFAATSDLATIADCLRHPACIGDTRQMVLHRLEELAFPPSEASKQQALAESVVTRLTQPLASGVLSAGRQANWERDRKFRTMWDAVAWLNKHHPEIDLDKPYTPRK